jgi:hypothetical protein
MGAAMPRQARLQRVNRYVSLSRGVKKRWMARGVIVLGGKSYTPQQILDQLKALIDAIDGTGQAYAAWREKRAKQRQLEEAMRPFVEFLGLDARLLYGRNLTALADFGLEPVKKPGPKTPTVKDASAKKAKATRAERGTMGKRQRKKDKA